MQHVDHYLIFNRRTGQVATGEWVRKHVITGPDNKPRMKNEASTAKPWIMTLRIDLVESNVQVYLRPKDNESFRRVRCFALQEGREKAKLAHITSGYAHLIHEGEGKGDGSGSEQEGDINQWVIEFQVNVCGTAIVCSTVPLLMLFSSHVA